MSISKPEKCIRCIQKRAGLDLLGSDKPENLEFNLIHSYSVCIAISLLKIRSPTFLLHTLPKRDQKCKQFSEVIIIQA